MVIGCQTWHYCSWNYFLLCHTWLWMLLIFSLAQCKAPSKLWNIFNILWPKYVSFLAIGSYQQFLFDYQKQCLQLVALARGSVFLGLPWMTTGNISHLPLGCLWWLWGVRGKGFVGEVPKNLLVNSGRKEVPFVLIMFSLEEPGTMEQGLGSCIYEKHIQLAKNLFSGGEKF